MADDDNSAPSKYPSGCQRDDSFDRAGAEAQEAVLSPVATGAGEVKPAPEQCPTCKSAYPNLRRRIRCCLDPWHAQAGAQDRAGRIRSEEGDRAMTQMMRLPQNSAYPDSVEIHPKDSWCERVGCTPVQVVPAEISPSRERNPHLAYPVDEHGRRGVPVLIGKQEQAFEYDASK
jgi:hypothetical protein